MLHEPQQKPKTVPGTEQNKMSKGRNMKYSKIFERFLPFFLADLSGRFSFIRNTPINFNIPPLNTRQNPPIKFGGWYDIEQIKMPKRNAGIF